MKKRYTGTMGSVTLDITKIVEIERQLKKKFYVKLGILGPGTKSVQARRQVITTKKGTRKAGKKEAAMTNAELGRIHEYGSISKNIPARSFLRVPLWLKFPGIIKKIGQQVIDGLTKSNIERTYKHMGIMAEKIVQNAFATRGFGRWPENSPRTIMRKKSDSPLIDTAQLRKSITSQVVSK